MGTLNVDQLRKSYLMYTLSLTTNKSSNLFGVTDNEKKTLEDEANSVNNQLKHLALSNYKTFIQTAECSHSVYKDVRIHY